MRIHWLRVTLAALAVEVVLLAIAVPLNLSADGQKALLYLVIPMCVLGVFLGGWWVARKAGNAFLLHGLLVGTAAALIYWALTLKVTLPPAYIVANYLKLPGGAAGGLLARALHRQSNKR